MKVLCLAALFAAGALFPVFAEPPEMTCEQYLAELQSVTVQEKVAREAIAKEQAQIENLKSQIAQIDLRIAAVVQEKYAILGITEQDVISAESELDGIKNALEQFSRLSYEEIRVRKNELDPIVSQFNFLKTKRVCLLYRVADKVAQVEALLSQVMSQLQMALAQPERRMQQEPTYSQYTVGRTGSAKNLSQIAQEVYSDQYQWPRIYRANKAKIDRWYERYTTVAPEQAIRRPQDYVLPGWTLEIPR